MPVRKRRDRRRTAADAGAWYGAFCSEFDLFLDLEGAGVKLDAYGRPDREEASQAWQQFGRAFLEEFAAEYPNGAHFTPWALAAFGDPR